MPILVCRDGRIREVQLRLVALSLGLCEARNGARPLCLQRLDLPLREPQGRLSTPKRGLLLIESCEVVRWAF